MVKRSSVRLRTKLLWVQNLVLLSINYSLFLSIQCLNNYYVVSQAVFKKLKYLCFFLLIFLKTLDFHNRSSEGNRFLTLMHGLKTSKSFYVLQRRFQTLKRLKKPLTIAAKCLTLDVCGSPGNSFG